MFQANFSARKISNGMAVVSEIQIIHSEHVHTITYYSCPHMGSQSKPIEVVQVH